MKGHREQLRYVAIGDSLSEGVGDEPWPDGSLRGWTDRLAHLLASSHQVEYANLAVRGYKARQIRDTQVAAAVAMKPHVVTLTAGMNDILRPRVNFDELQETLVEVVAPFTTAGARLVVVPIPDVTRISPAGSLVNSRRLKLNAIYRMLVREHGIEPITDTTGTVFEDARAWDEDRLHLSALGHERLAFAAAASLGHPFDVEWSSAPDGPSPPRTVRTDFGWWWEYTLPWIGRRLLGKSSGDGRQAKRPELAPLQIPQVPPRCRRGSRSR